MSWTRRPGGPGDADAITRLTHESFEGFRVFAAPGWTPSLTEDEARWVRERLDHREVWCEVAESDGDLVGHVALMPGPLAREPTQEPGLAHFWMLFVRASHWGTGLAGELHAAALREAAARGFSSMRLFTPAGHARARRFYEREGWSAAGAPFEDEDFGLAVVEYRRPLERP